MCKSMSAGRLEVLHIHRCDSTGLGWNKVSFAWSPKWSILTFDATLTSINHFPLNQIVVKTDVGKQSANYRAEDTSLWSASAGDDRG